MRLEEFLARRHERLARETKYRELCSRCFQSEKSCYCSELRPFDSAIKFVILIHPIEVKRRIATGRMSHLSLKNSELIEGQDFSQHDRINELCSDEKLQPMVLYPGATSNNLTTMTASERAGMLDSSKTPLIFVIDGTWATAKKMMRESSNLKNLPRVCFTPPHPSRFRVRKQPAENCFATIEAIHHCIELLGEASGADITRREHDALLSVFDYMVEKQLEYFPY